MSSYFIEILRGEDHVFLGYAQDKKPRIHPQERNAATLASLIEGNIVMAMLLELDHDTMRELVKVNKSYDRPLRISLRKYSANMESTMVAQKMYQFKEPAV